MGYNINYTSYKRLGGRGDGGGGGTGRCVLYEGRDVPGVGGKKKVLQGGD